MAALRRVFQAFFQRSKMLHYSYQRQYSSVLFMTGDKAKETYSVLTPHIDADERFQDMSLLKDNIKLRGMEMDVDKIKAMWDILKSVENDKRMLEARRVEIANIIKEAKKAGGDNGGKTIEALKLQGKLLRDDLKTTTKAVWELEKKIIPKILKLPNNLHSKTPRKEVEILTELGHKSEKQIVESHIEIGERLDVLDFYTSEFYYLKGEAAVFELNLLNYFANEIASHDFVHFCNSDFSRSVVVEGCGIDEKDANETYILEDTDILDIKDTNRLHLVGGASIVSFCSFHTKQIVAGSSLPLRLVAVGRQYKPDRQKHSSYDLFNVCQNSSVEIFVSSINDENESLAEFDRCVKMLTNIYIKLGYPFRVVYVPAMELQLHESLRASFQMYSPHRHSYIEIGNVSLCGDFISKRLLMQYKVNKKQAFSNIISGTVVQIPKLLGCLLEMYCDVEQFSEIPIAEGAKGFI